MKTDLYTKILLTIIAISLVIIVLRDVSITPTATAQTNTLGVLDVNLVAINGIRLYDDCLEVNVKNKVQFEIPYWGLDVNVKNKVELDTPYGGLDVRVTNYDKFK